MENKGNQLEVITPKDLLMTNSPFTAEQIQLFYQETPKDRLMKRPAKGGGTWDYVQTGYVIDTLNRIFGYMWSFEVLTSLAEAAQIATSGTCVVKGRLTVLAGDKTLVKEQFGRCEVKFKTAYNAETRQKERTNEFLDFGNDMKGAASDALKKCASELGLFRDVYHKDDFQQMTVVDEEEKQRMEEEEVEKAKEQLRSAENMAALQGVWIRLPSKIRLDKSVIASKDALKRKFLKKSKKGAENGNNDSTAATAN